PVRLLETRPSFPGSPLTGCYRTNAPLPGNASRTQQARGTCDGLTIPTNAVSIVGNATVVNTGAGSQAGFVTLYPRNATLPTASNLNFIPGQIVPNAFTVGLGSDGAFKIFTTAATDFIVDIAGYYSPDATDINGEGLLYSPLPRPLRLLETRPDFPGFPLT